MLLVRSFSTTSRPALRAACGRPPARQPLDGYPGHGLTVHASDVDVIVQDAVLLSLPFNLAWMAAGLYFAFRKPAGWSIERRRWCSGRSASSACSWRWLQHLWRGPNCPRHLRWLANEARVPWMGLAHYPELMSFA
jgi:hypothetical protein